MPVIADRPATLREGRAASYAKLHLPEKFEALRSIRCEIRRIDRGARSDGWSESAARWDGLHDRLDVVIADIERHRAAAVPARGDGGRR